MFADQDLSETQLQHKKLEIQMNKHIDDRLRLNPEKLPTAVYYIIPNELGERFCYYGLTPILRNFLKYQLGYINKVDGNWLIFENSICCLVAL
jgi:dipeptide/tripeptide permease